MIKDLEHLETTLRTANLRSRRYERNIQNATWSWTFDVSIETFILFVSAFRYDSLTHRNSSLPLLLAKIRELEYQERISCHPVLKEWACCLREQGFKVPRSTRRSVRRHIGVRATPVVDGMLHQLRHDPAFRRHLPDHWGPDNMSLVSAPSPDVQELCKENSIELPRIVPANGTWGQTGPPTFHQVFSHVWRYPKKVDLRVFEREELSEQPSVMAASALSQLMHPDKRNPASIIGIDFPDLLSRWKFGSCAELHRHVTTALERLPVINVTPQYSYVDIHIDYGMDGISAVLGDCQKLIILFPPSSRNLRVLQQERGNQAKLARTMPLLEYGLVDRLDSTNAIFIPSGWAHATFTTRGGFLVSVDCATKRTVWTFSQYLRYDLYRELDSKQQAECWFLFLDCLEYALACHETSLASRSWCNIEDKLKQITGMLWRRRASQVWRRMTDSSPGVMMEDGSSNAHIPLHQFWKRHLSWLDDEANVKRKARRSA